MRSIVDIFVDRILNDRQDRRILLGVILLLAVIVVFIVYWSLHYTGVAMTNEVYCGQEEHLHDETCYTWELTCGLEESAGSEGHTHDDSCYETMTELVCGLEESEGHIHDDFCLDEYGNLICAIPESEGHTHTDACYETTRVLVCGLEETPAAAGHTHTADCYIQVLTCGMEEHVHTMACMTDETADVETEKDWVLTLPEEGELTGIWNEDIVSIAESQIGYTESEKNFQLADDGSTRNGYTRYGAWYGNEYGDWDAMFAAFCLYYAGVTEETLPYNAGAYAWIVELEELADKNEIDEPIYVSAGDHTPEPGDIVFLDTDGDDKADTVAIVAEVLENRNDAVVSLKLVQGDYEDAVTEYTVALDDGAIVGFGVIPEQPVTEQPAENELFPVASAEDTEIDAADVIDSASVTGDSLVAGTPGTASGGSDASDEMEKDTAAYSQASGDASEEAADDSASDEASGEASEEASEETELTTLTYEGEDYAITVTYGPEAELPEDVQFIAFEYDTDSETYLERYAEAAELYGWDEGSEEETGDEDTENAEENVRENSIRLFNIGLYVADENGEITEVEPAAPVEVTITYHDAAGEGAVVDGESDEGEEDGSGEDGGSHVFSITHFGDEAERVESESGSNDDGESVTFELESFSDIMVVPMALANEEVTIVLNLGNVRGTTTAPDGIEIPDRYFAYNMNDYDNPMRYSVTVKSDSDGKVYVNLPGDNNVGQSFTISGNSTVVSGENTVTMGHEDSGYINASGSAGYDNYDYRLVGWYDIYTGEYYDVSGDPNGRTIEIEVDENDTITDHVFYADWIAATYDRGKDASEDELVDAVSTGGFVTIKMFDYNELFNLYGTYYVPTYNSANELAEWWYTASYTDSEGTTYNVMFADPLLNNSSYDVSDSLGVGSPLFYTTALSSNQVYGLENPANRSRQNSSLVNTASVFGFSEMGNDLTDNLFLNYLFNENNDDNDGGTLGVYYVGEADYLFQYGTEESIAAAMETAAENGASEEDLERLSGYVGYYYYDSAINSASYNQSEGRFYVYKKPTDVNRTNEKQQITDSAGFFPYNTYTDEMERRYGTDYWFGMTMEVEFYLPNTVGNVSGNKVNGEDMVFNFSGDDDILVFVDDILVLDMSGVHYKEYGYINFSTGEVMRETSDAQKKTGTEYLTVEGFNSGTYLSSGEHTLTVYYMERGTDSSNLTVEFNITPYWEYETGPMQTVFAKKEWKDSSGRTIEGEGTEYCPDVDFGLFQAMDYVVNGDGTYTITGDYTFGDTNYNGKTYTLDEDGYSRDGNGLIQAWLAVTSNEDGSTTPVVDENGNQKLYVRVDVQNLSYADEEKTYLDPETGKYVHSYGWYWDWESLDPYGDYTVLELSEDKAYSSEVSYAYPEEGGFYYWTIIGESELEDMLISGAYQDGDALDYYVILTDAAQHVNGDSLSTGSRYGNVIYYNGINGVGTAQAEFTQEAELRSHQEGDYFVYWGTYGALASSVVQALEAQDDISGVVWEMEMVDELAGDIGGNVLHMFRLFYLDEDGVTRHYLTEDSRDGGNTYYLTTTTVRENAGEFYDDAMGELRIHLKNDVYRAGDNRIYIDSNGNIGVGPAATEDDDGHNVKIYTWSAADTSGYVFTWTNTLNPDVSVKKVDSGTGASLAGAGFILGQLQDVESITDWITGSAGRVTSEDLEDALWYAYEGNAINTVTVNIEAEGTDGEDNTLLASLQVTRGRTVRISFDVRGSAFEDAIIESFAVYDADGNEIDTSKWEYSLGKDGQGIYITVPGDVLTGDVTIVLTGTIGEDSFDFTTGEEPEPESEPEPEPEPGEPEPTPEPEPDMVTVYATTGSFGNDPFMSVDVLKGQDFTVSFDVSAGGDDTENAVITGFEVYDAYGNMINTTGWSYTLINDGKQLTITVPGSALTDDITIVLLGTLEEGAIDTDTGDHSRELTIEVREGDDVKDGTVTDWEVSHTFCTPVTITVKGSYGGWFLEDGDDANREGKDITGWMPESTNVTFVFNADGTIDWDYTLGDYREKTTYDTNTICLYFFSGGGAYTVSGYWYDAGTGSYYLVTYDSSTGNYTDKDGNVMEHNDDYDKYSVSPMSIRPYSDGDESTRQGLSWVEDREDATTVTTSRDNEYTAVFHYLEDGVYYLEEIVVPEGYNRLFDYIAFSIEDGVITNVWVTSGGVTSQVVMTPVDLEDPEAGYTSSSAIVTEWDGDDLTLTVANAPTTELPSTGRLGYWAFTTVGLAVIAAAGGLLAVRSRIRKRDEGG